MASINVFEGSRRIAPLIKLLWVVSIVVVRVDTSPHVSLNFVSSGPDRPLQKTPRNLCTSADVARDIIRDLDGGGYVSITLCFTASAFGEDRKLLVPYNVDQDGSEWANTPQAAEVLDYAKRRSDAFTLSAVDFEAASRLWQEQHRTHIREGVIFAIGGWSALSVIQLLIGWIVRRFLGIPWRQDRRPDLMSDHEPFTA